MPHPLIAKFASRFGGRKGPSHCIGLDAGSSSIKAIKLRRTDGHQVEILQAETAPLSGPEPAQRAEAIRQMAEKFGCRETPVVASVGGPGTVLRRVSLPSMTPVELRSALSFEAEKYIPFKLDEVFFDFAVLGDRPGGQMEVFLGAARKELVNDLVEILSACGTPLAVDLETAALANAWEAAPAAAGEGVTCLLHVGNRGTVLDFIRGSQLEFAREIPVGGSAFKDAGGASPPPSWEEWLTQCRASFDFFEDQSGRRVERLALSGGGARLPGFKEWVQEASGLLVQVWDPLSGVPGSELAGEQGREALVIAMGLALRGLRG